MNKTQSLRSALVEAKKAKVSQLKEQFNAIKVENVFRKTLKQLS